MQSSRPATWPLGALALGVAVLAALLSVTYFASPLAYVAAAVALALLAAGAATAGLPWI